MSKAIDLERAEDEDFERFKFVKNNPEMVGDLLPPEESSLQCPYGGGRFESKSDGICFITKDKDGDDLPEQWICSPLHLVAMTRDANSSEWGSLWEWSDKDGVGHQLAIPLELLQGDGLEVRRLLARGGLTISPGRKARELLTSFLQVTVKDRARCVDRLGWHGGVFVTPQESVGESLERIVFQNPHASCIPKYRWRAGPKSGGTI